MFNLRGYDRVKAIHLLNKSISEKGDKNGHKAMILKNIKLIQNIKIPNFFGIKKLNYIKNLQIFSEEKKNHVKNRIKKNFEFDNYNDNNKNYIIKRKFNKISKFKPSFFDSYFKDTYGNLKYDNNSVYQNYKNMTNINNIRKKIEIKKNKMLSNQISIGINTDIDNEYNYNNEYIIFPKINHIRNQTQFKTAKISFIKKNEEEDKINNNNLNKNKTFYINDAQQQFFPFQNLLISEKMNLMKKNKK